MSSFSSSSRFCVVFLRSLAMIFEVGLDCVHADDVVVLGKVHAVDATALRPIGRTFRFAKRMAWPSWLARKSSAYCL